MKKLIHAVWASLLALTLILPLCLGAAAEEATVTGYAFQYDSTSSQGYISNWQGSEIKVASYAAWVKTDGAFQGVLQWSPSASGTKITLDSATGVLRFDNAGNSGIQLNPVENGRFAAGVSPLFISFETKPETGNYSGTIFGILEDSKDLGVFCIDGEGKLYKGAEANPDLYTGVNLTMDAWNTVRMYVIPAYDGSAHTGYTVYLDVRVTSDVAEGWGVTQTELDSMLKISWPTTKLFSSNSSGKPYFKGGASQGVFNMANLRVFRMTADAALYKVSFEGYPEYTTYAPVDGGQDTSFITVPAAAGVEYWTAGEGTSAEFLKPGDQKRITASATYAQASGSQLDIAALMSAVNALNLSKVQSGVYTYAELAAASADIKTAVNKAVASGGVSDQPGGSYYEYYEKAMEALETLIDRMDAVEANALDLIDAYQTFGDEEVPLEDRIFAYENVKDLDIDYTYSDECATAYYARNAFSALLDAIREDWAAYEAEIIALQTTTGADIGYAVESLLKHIINIRLEFSSFQYDDLFTQKYEEYLATQTAAIKATDSLAEKYSILEEMVGLYNSYHEGLFRSTKVIPDIVMEAINDYNAAIAAVNQEVLEAVTVTGAGMRCVVPNDVIGNMVANVTYEIASKVTVDDDED